MGGKVYGVSYRLPDPYSAPPFRLLHHPEDNNVVTLPVPGYRQSRNYSCGFAVVLMLMRHYRRTLRGRAIFEALGTARDGTGQNAIIRVLRSESIRARIRYDVDFSQIVSCINEEKILIGYLEDEGHWVLLYGYGNEPQRVFVADPEPNKPCEYFWDSYGPRLGGFAIVCSVGEQPQQKGS